MSLLVILFAATLFLAYSNGANDNFKGVATLYASKAASYRVALLVGTIATFAGCLMSVYLAEGLIKAFSGKGLVPDAIAGSSTFLVAVASAAGATVILATWLGFPISTTHALTGALTGAGFVTAGSQLNLSALGTAFFLPLLLSPVLSVFLAMALYKITSSVATATGVQREPLAPLAQPLSAAVNTAPLHGIKYSGGIFGPAAQKVVDSLHYLSAAAVSFARGLNDTPKIAGLVLALKAVDIKLSMVSIASAMAIGGLLNARKVAETMSHKISRMNDGQALTANLVTAMLVTAASKFGLPVSTTHVSVGAISGIGLVNGTADRSVISSILLSWLLTLPIAALLAALVSWGLSIYGNA